MFQSTSIIQDQQCPDDYNFWKLFYFDSVRSLLLNCSKTCHNINEEIIFSQWNFLNLEFFQAPHWDDIA